MGGDFKNHICGCYKNPILCLFSYCCPCYVYGKVAESVGENCLMYGALTVLPCRVCFNWKIRGKVREKYGVDGDMKMDIACHCCCPLCAIIQEANEVQENNDAPPGTIIMSRD